jgi:hypothetical protein
VVAWLDQEAVQALADNNLRYIEATPFMSVSGSAEAPVISSINKHLL